MKFQFAAMRVSAVLSLAILATACPEEKVEPPADTINTTPLTVTEICGLYNSQNDNGDLCVQASVKSALDYDAATLSRNCRPGTDGRVWAEDLLASLSAGRVKIDWGLAHKCLDESRSMRKNNPGYMLVQDQAWDDLATGACTEFFAGITPDGQMCSQDWDCADGSACASDSPFEGTAVCLKAAGVDEQCGDYHSCDTGLYCGPANSCLTQLADGANCDSDLSGDDCLSGSCGDDGKCAPTAVLKDFGEACTDDDECGGDCAKCRPASDGAATTCMIFGARGDYCRDWNDCLNDLGCTNHVCGTVGAGQGCGGATQALCDAGLSCIPTENCASFADEASCNAHSPTCAFDSQNNACSASQGQCTADSALPATGSCLYGYVCAEHHFCAGGTCTALATEGQSCSEAGSPNPYCDTGLSCLNGSCIVPCEFNEDCSNSQFCADDGSCQAQNLSECHASNECPESQYCDLPEDTCTGLDEATCGTTSGCAYSADDADCLPSPALVGPCKAQLEVGAICGDSGQCLSGDCADDGTGATRCAVELSGCNRDADFLRDVFLFGTVLVLMGGRRRRRNS